MEGKFIKTAAGQLEIQARALALSRPVRNLLLVINDSQPVNYWLGSVRGISEADIEQLLAQGLIAPAAPPKAPNPLADPTTSPGASTPASAGVVLSPESADSDWTRLLQDIASANYVQLYDVLTSQGKSHLGLMKGYRFALEVEKCSGPEALRALARQFVEQLRDEAGMNAVRRFSEALLKA